MSGVVPNKQAQNGVVSSLNSTTSPLNASSTYTGTWENVSLYQSLVVAIKTDQNGTYTIEFSPDGVNADSVLTRYYRTNQIEAPNRFTVTRKYVRITFQNTSVSNQTYLRLQVLYGDKTELNAPTDSLLAQDYDAIVVRPTDFKYEVALGRRQGATTWNKFGYNADVDIGTETVWNYPGGNWTKMAAADTLNIVSSSVNDDDGGTGANGVVVYGVDENWVSQTEVVTLNGTTPVTTAGSWLGVNRVAVYLAGSGEANAGNITISATSGGSVQGYIAAGEGTTQQLIFFVQDNHQMLADWMLLNTEKIAGGTTPKVTFKGWVFSEVSNAKYEVFRQLVDTNVDDHIELNPSQPFIIGEKSIFWIEATTDVNNTVASGRFSLIEFRDVNA